jgi:phosphopantetheine adenylyltransferase
MQTSSSLPWTEILSIIASIVSLILGGFAIWLSFVFYRLSNESSAKIKEAADRIGSSVDRLEVLFNKLYADTFSMMKDTVTDMRKHIWRDDTTLGSQVDEEAEKRADEKINQLQERLQQEVSQLLDKQSSTDAQIVQIGSEMKQLVNRAIIESRRAELEAREETVRDHIMQIIRKMNSNNQEATLTLLHSLLEDKFPRDVISAEVFRMAEEKILNWNGAPNSLRHADPIKLVVPGSSAT